MIYFNSTTWNPGILAVLCFIRTANDVLLIHKRRGMGRGKVNGPGGKCEPGELPIDTAIRETMEEVCVIPGNLQEHGTLRFQFSDGFQLEGRVFVAASYSGKPADTPEALPFWCPLEDIPYERMWSDDILWLPYVLAGEYVEAAFTFHSDTMISQHVSRYSDPASMGISSVCNPAGSQSQAPVPADTKLLSMQRLYAPVAALCDPHVDRAPHSLGNLIEYAGRMGFNDLHARLSPLQKHFASPRVSALNHSQYKEVLAEIDFHYLRAISFLKEQTFRSAVLY